MVPARQRTKPRIRDSDAARAAILKAAVAEFTQKGLAGARMDAIARAAGVAKGLVFHHFGSKEDLWTAALETVYALLRAGQDETGLTALGPVEGMRKLVRETFRLFRDHPEIVALMNEENLHRARHLRAAINIPVLYNPLFAAIEHMLAQGHEAGVFRRNVDVTALYVALSGLGYFYCANRWTLSSAFAGDLFTPDRIARYEAMIADMIVAYLRESEGAAPRQSPGGRMRVAVGRRRQRPTED
jgi:TetR/AcrR family transcriptional regulator